MFLADCENERVKGTKDEGGTAGLIAFVEEDNRLSSSPSTMNCSSESPVLSTAKTRRGELDR